MNPSKVITKQANKNNGALLFIKEVAKYFMDFLETDFHKRKNPKRSVQLRNRDNLLVGLNLAKYPEFNKFFRLPFFPAAVPAINERVVESLKRLARKEMQ